MISLDHATGRNIIQEPIEELKQLRGDKVTVSDVDLAPGDVVEVKGARGEQVLLIVLYEHSLLSVFYTADTCLSTCHDFNPLTNYTNY